MTPRLLGLMVAVLLCGCAGLAPDARDRAGAAARACTATAARASSDARIAAAVGEARRQHQLFGGQTIEPNGGLFRIGDHEAEWWRPAPGAASAWQRVASFWQALADSEPPTLMTSVGRVSRFAASAAPAASGGESGAADIAVREALLRAAIVDTPWSAAFISYLMTTGGFLPAEFAFSDSHADYVQAAIATSAAEAAGGEASHAFRACDAARTPPRAGDLLCATRGSTAHIVGFDALVAALSTRVPGQGFPMHCDLVVRSDQRGGGSLDLIGGNVVNSVTLSRMRLNARKVLRGEYVVGTGARRHCDGGAPQCRGHLSRRPWVVLLQFRQ